VLASLLARLFDPPALRQSAAGRPFTGAQRPVSDAARAGFPTAPLSRQLVLL